MPQKAALHCAQRLGLHLLADPLAGPRQRAKAALLGFGQALAQALRTKGNRVILTGRNPGSLNCMLQRNPDMAGYRLDVTDGAALARFVPMGTVSSGLAFAPNAANPVYSATKAAIHGWTLAQRHQLRTTDVAVHKIAPPLVATELTCGQSRMATAMPLAEFTRKVAEILSRDEVPVEILASRVNVQRRAEPEGRLDATFAAIDG